MHTAGQGGNRKGGGVTVRSAVKPAKYSTEGVAMLTKRPQGRMFARIYEMANAAPRRQRRCFSLIYINARRLRTSKQ